MRQFLFETNFLLYFFTFVGALGMFLIILGLIDKKRKTLFYFLGALLVTIYAIYFGNPLFIALQLLIVFSTSLSLGNVREGIRSILVINAAILLLLVFIFSNFITNFYDFLAVFGLLCLALGFASKYSFRQNVEFLLGGVTIAIYGLMVKDWIFLLLNSLFSILAAKEMILLYRLNKQRYYQRLLKVGIISGIVVSAGYLVKKIAFRKRK